MVEHFEQTLLWQPASASCRQRSDPAALAATQRKRAIITAAFDAAFGPGDATNPAHKWHYAPKPLPMMIINSPPRVPNQLAVVIEYRDSEISALDSDNSYPITPERGPYSPATRQHAQTCLSEIADVDISRVCNLWVDEFIDLDNPQPVTNNYPVNPEVHGVIQRIMHDPHFIDFYSANAIPLYCAATRAEGMAEIQASIKRTERIVKDTISTHYFVVVDSPPNDAGNQQPPGQQPPLQQVPLQPQPGQQLPLQPQQPGQQLLPGHVN